MSVARIVGCAPEIRRNLRHVVERLFERRLTGERQSILVKGRNRARCRKIPARQSRTRDNDFFDGRRLVVQRTLVLCEHKPRNGEQK